MSDLRAVDLLPVLYGQKCLRDLASSASVVSLQTSCDQVAALFRADPLLLSILVPDGDRVGLVSRGPFEHSFDGRFGYGRALYGRHSISLLADWEPLLLPIDIKVEEAAVAVLERNDGNLRADIVVVWPDGTLGTVADTVLYRSLAGEYAHHALHDALTGIPNRALFLRRLAEACANPLLNPVGVFFIDLDDFKEVNDQLGHNVGDTLLQQIAGRLSAARRPADSVARLGGDEFAVLLKLERSDQRSATAPDFMAAVGQRLLDALSAPLLLGGMHLQPRASIGAALSSTHADPETLLREADLAMYRAKTAGGNQIVVVNNVATELRAPVLGALGIDDTLQEALRAGQFRVHYQPIVDLLDQRVVSVEALVRWAHPTGGLHAPADFLPDAERTGFITTLGVWVLDEACRQLADWDVTLGDAAPERISVNLAIRQLADPQLVPIVVDALHRHRLPAQRLILELPEGATLAQMQDAVGSLGQLRGLGVGITLDDLGTGASTLRHISALVVDGLKIDKSFVDGMIDRSSDAAIVRLLLELAHAIGVPATAEGVETSEQLRLLAELGCRYVQGYLIARPADASTTGRWLSTQGSVNRLQLEGHQ